MHLLQSEEARSECRNLMIPQRHIISAQGNSPSIGLVQDSLLASMKFTKGETMFERDKLCNLLMWMKSWDGKIPEPEVKEPKELWSGRQVFSLLLPQMNYTKKSNSSNPKNEMVEIIKGSLKNGVIDKKTVGKSANSLIHVIFNDYGPDAVTDFINDLQLVVNYWLLHDGSSIGLSDMIGPREAMIKINDIINTANENVKVLSDDLKNDRIKSLPGKTIIETFEDLVKGELSGIQDDIVSIIQNSLPDSNNLKQMMESGSKGKELNMFRIIGCVGQQAVKGKIIGKGFKDRTLPFYKRNDMSIEGRGFVKSSYIKGLNPREFYFHAMSKFTAHKSKY